MSGDKTCSGTPDQDFHCFYPFEIPALGKDKKEQPHAGRTSIPDVIVMLKWLHHVASQHIQDFLEGFFEFFPIYEVLSGEQENESIIHVRMG